MFRRADVGSAVCQGAGHLPDAGDVRPAGLPLLRRARHEGHVQRGPHPPPGDHRPLQQPTDGSALTPRRHNAMTSSRHRHDIIVTPP